MKVFDLSELSQRKDGSIVLPAGKAVVHGGSLAFEEGNQNLGFWTNVKDWCEFEFTVDQLGTFSVLIDQACAQGQGGSTAALALGNQRLVATVRDTGGWNRFETVEVGRLKIQKAGTHRLSLQPINLMKGVLMDLRTVTLKPVK